MSGDCQECDGSGFVVDEATNTARDCECRPGRRSRIKASRLEARLPKRFQHVAFEREPVVGLHPEIVRKPRRFARDIERNLDEGQGIWFVGGVGTYKTTLAMLVSKAALEAGRSVAIYSVPRLLSVLRESMDSEQGLLRLIEDLSEVDLLHLDDLGAERSTDWVLEQLYAILNARYEEQRSLVVTTNLGVDELTDQLGPRIVRRILEICGDPVPTGQEDRRAPAAAADEHEIAYVEELERRAGMLRSAGES